MGVCGNIYSPRFQYSIFISSAGKAQGFCVCLFFYIAFYVFSPFTPGIWAVV